MPQTQPTACSSTDSSSNASDKVIIRHDVIERRAQANRLNIYVQIKPHKKVTKQRGCVNINAHRSIPVQSYQGDEVKATIFYLPGNASIANCAEAIDAHASQMAAVLQCRVVVIHPRLVPENKHPIPYNDAVAVINHLIKQGLKDIVDDDGKPYDFKSKPLAIAGYSSGGLLATQIYLNSMQTGMSPFCYLIAIGPILDIANLSELNYVENQQHFKEIFERFASLYLPEGQPLKSKHHSPSYINLSKLQLTTSAMTFVVGEKDPLKPQIMKFSQAVEAQGSQVERIIIPDFDHGLTWQTTAHLNQIVPRFHSLLPEGPVKKFKNLEKLKKWNIDKKSSPTPEPDTFLQHAILDRQLFFALKGYISAASLTAANNKKKRNIIHYAALNIDDIRVFQQIMPVLLEKSNQLKLEINQADADGYTPLMTAITVGFNYRTTMPRSNMVDYFNRYAPDIIDYNFINKEGVSALSLALSLYHFDEVESLLKLGADPHVGGEYSADSILKLQIANHKKQITSLPQGKENKNFNPFVFFGSPEQLQEQKNIQYRVALEKNLIKLEELLKRFSEAELPQEPGLSC